MIATGNAEALGFDPERLARIRPWMQRWVDEGKFPGAQTLIARHGEIAYCDQVGMRDIENGTPWERDTLARIYSMTKPITSVALLMLFEEARCHIDTPVDEFIPEFADRQALIEGAVSLDQVRPAKTRMTLHHLLTHALNFLGDQGCRQVKLMQVHQPVHGLLFHLAGDGILELTLHVLAYFSLELGFITIVHTKAFHELGVHFRQRLAFHLVDLDLEHD